MIVASERRCHNCARMQLKKDTTVSIQESKINLVIFPPNIMKKKAKQEFKIDVGS